MYPMKMRPIYKDYLWGGCKLNTLFNKTSKLAITAESWELSCCQDGLSIIENGNFAGQSLKDVLKNNIEMMKKDNDSNNKEFPLLIKLIDANDRLSIQVHPSDLTADKSKNQQGKAEMWYVLDCDKDAFLYMGLSKQTDKKELKQKIDNGTLCDILNKIEVKKSDVFYIAPGTVHAIGKGILIAEIQQNSNTTFRMFDYNRKNPDGKTRELHIDEAIRVVNNEPFTHSRETQKMDKRENYSVQELVHNKYFKVDKYDVYNNMKLCVEKSFQSILIIDGTCNIIYNNKKYKANKGDNFFLPAGMGEYIVNGKCEFILATI